VINPKVRIGVQIQKVGKMGLKITLTTRKAKIGILIRGQVPHHNNSHNKKPQKEELKVNLFLQG
jgi:hypothetical protein